MIQTSAEINEIATACAKAQAELENVGKDAINPHFRARYATLAAVLAEVRPKYAKHGVAIFQGPANGEGSNIGVTTKFAHSSGQWIESTIYVSPMKFDAQGVGSVLSYLRRYSLMAMAGVGTDDDDGNAAVARPEQRAQSNGHAAPPPPRPAPIEPPHDPETGEISPHKIVPPVADGTGLINWIGFGGQLIAAFKSARDIAELAQWDALNRAAVEEMEKAAPRAHRSVVAARQMMEKQLTAQTEMVSAEETGDLLR